MTGAAGPVRVFIVDDHRLFLSGVRAELSKAFEIVGEAADVEEAVQGIGVAGPDVVLVDVHMPGGGGAAVVEAVRRVHDGDAVFSPRLAGFVLDAFADTQPQVLDPELDRLTGREREVLRLIARGYTYRDIAADLHLSVKTVETHVSSVLRKLQLSNRHQLTRWATERRIV